MSANMNIIKVTRPLVFAYFLNLIKLYLFYDNLFFLLHSKIHRLNPFGSAESAHINVESSDVCIVCGSSKPHNAPVKIDISDSPQSPHKKRTRRYM